MVRLEDARAIRESYRHFCRATRLTKERERRRLSDCPLLSFTSPSIPYLLYYPASDRVELDAAAWKLAAGRSVVTIH